MKEPNASLVRKNISRYSAIRYNDDRWYLLATSNRRDVIFNSRYWVLFYDSSFGWILVRAMGWVADVPQKRQDQAK